MKNLITKITFITLLSVSAIQGKAQQFTLSGKLTGGAGAPIILNYVNTDGKSIIDSASVQNGNFTFKGNISGGVLAYLYPSHRSSKTRIGNTRNTAEIFLEPTDMTANGSYDNLPALNVAGSKSQTEYEALADLFKPSDAKMDAIEDKWLANQAELLKIIKTNKYDARLAPINNTMDSLNDIIVANTKRVVKQFIANHQDSYVSAYELNQYKTRWKIGEVTAIYKSLTTDKQNCYDGKQIKAVITGIENNAAGKMAKNFTSVDADGKNVSLADFKGRYVLLDFWGSWCAPCRAAVPHLKSLFAKYHKNGLEVLAIAVDDTPADWNKAIKKDGTDIWYNIMQPSRRNENVDKAALIDDAYHINVYPSKILVGKDGVIVGRYDGTDSTAALDKKLAELFKGSD